MIHTGLRAMCELNMQIKMKWGCDGNIIPRIRRDSFQWGRTHTNKNHDIFPQIQQHPHRMSWGSVLQVSSQHYHDTGHEDCLYRWGKLVTRHPYPVILTSITATVLCSLGFLVFRYNYVIIITFVMSCYTSQLSHRTVTLLRDLLLAVVFWCTWCSLRCSHWTLLLSRIEHKANLLWIPADSDYNTKQVWKTLISFRDGLVTHQKKVWHDILNEIWTMFDISFHIVSGLARPTFWVTVKRRNYVIFQWKYFNSWVNQRNV